MNASFAGKDAKRECDYRLSLVDLSKLIVGQNILKEYHLLFLSLVEIQGILYAAEVRRTAKEILRLYI